jgi:hypothetical protein
LSRQQGKITVLRQIFRTHILRLGLSYALLAAEFTVFALLPFLLGRAIDALLAGDRFDFAAYLGVSLLAVLLGFLRRRFDNRMFLRIWCLNVVRKLGRMMSARVDSTTIVSRSFMVKEYANFLECTVPLGMSAVIEMGTAVVMLYLFVPRIAFGATFLAMGGVAASYWFAAASMRQEVRCQRLSEEINGSIIRGDPAGMGKGYEEQRSQYVRLSDLESVSWVLADVLGTLAVVLVAFGTVHAGYSAGVIMSNLAYAQRLLEKTMLLACVFRHWQQLRAYDSLLEEA